MITRIWQAWTTHEAADDYETLLTTQIFPAIRSKSIDGLKHMELLRRAAGDEIEFVVIFRFSDADSIRAMTGGSMDQAYVPDSARKILKRFEDTARHFERRYPSTETAVFDRGASYE